jgi:hypothetical protein
MLPFFIPVIATSVLRVLGAADSLALPDILKVWWVSTSPLAFLFAGRILWEKTLWTWSRGPQMVGFSLWHIHPGFAVAGLLCSLAVALWLLITIPYDCASPRHRTVGLVNDGRFSVDHLGFGRSRDFFVSP